MKNTILNNSSLDIHTNQGLKVKSFHKYTDSVGKNLFTSWEVGHELNKELKMVW